MNRKFAVPCFHLLLINLVVWGIYFAVLYAKNEPFFLVLLPTCLPLLYSWVPQYILRGNSGIYDVILSVFWMIQNYLMFVVVEIVGSSGWMLFGVKETLGFGVFALANCYFPLLLKNPYEEEYATLEVPILEAPKDAVPKDEVCEVCKEKTLQEEPKDVDTPEYAREYTPADSSDLKAQIVKPSKRKKKFKKNIAKHKKKRRKK